MTPYVKVFALMAALTALVVGAGQLVGGGAGAVTALGFAIVMNLGMYFFSDRIVLRMYGAQRVSPAEAPELYAAVDRLRRAAEDSNPIGALLMLIVGPIAAAIIQMAISRQREFEADRVGALITRNPPALASSLRKLDASAKKIPMHVAPAAAPLAQVNPLAAHGGGILKLFSTHPPTEERVARLLKMPLPEAATV